MRRGRVKVWVQALPLAASSFHLSMAGNLRGATDKVPAVAVLQRTR